MKKILSIISAGLLVVLAASCNKDEKATFDPSDVTAPVLGTVTVGTDVVVNYTPAVFNLDFNKKMIADGGYYHTLGMIAVNDEKCDVTLSSAKVSGTSIKISGTAVTSALQLRGFEVGETVKVAIVVRASIQDPSKGVTNGYVDSEDSYEFDWTLTEKKGGNPYAGFEPTEEWSVIGSIASTGNSWGQDEPMLTDGTWYVCRNIELTTSDEFKFRKDHDWGVNFGGTFSAFDTEFAVEQNGANIKVTADGKYDLLLNPTAAVAKVVEAYDPYAGFEETTVWSVIGSIASTGNSWGQDEPMLTNGTWYLCVGIELTTSDEFKFRKDHDWGTNFGGTFASFGDEFAVEQNGANIKVTEDGTYDLLLNPDAATAKVVVNGEDLGI